MAQKLNCIMLIDDDEPTNFLSSMIIEECDCTEHLQIEDSAVGALNYLTNSIKSGSGSKQYPWPDLILLDINMPAMNGWEFLKKYKVLCKKCNDSIIIMLTTSLNPSDKSRADAIEEVAEFKYKPLTEEVLHEVLQKHFIECKCMV